MGDFRQLEVLLVEDNATDARLTLRALKQKNLANSVLWVKDGQEALDCLFGRGEYADVPKEQRRFRIILLDLKLPKVDGIEVLREIRGSPETRHIPVVVMTSSHEERDLIDSYKLGVNSYVVKPIEFDKFVDVVSEVGLYWLLVNRAPPDNLGD
jgi:two-component system, response regulator